MPARKKSLPDFVRDQTFLARRHAELLLTEDLVRDPVLREIQKRFRRRRGLEERSAIALEFQRAVQTREPGSGAELEALLASLGPPGSAEQVLGFFPRFLRHAAGPKAGKRFNLEPFQREFVSEFFARDHGERLYSVGLLGVPKGNGKTPLAAGLGVYALVSARDAPEVYSIAGSKEQARIAHRFANRWVEEGELGEWVQPGRTLRVPETGGFYSVLSADGRLSQGVQPSAGIVDEWWLFEHRREREAKEALGAALHKRPGEAWLLAISTAGWSKASQLGETFDEAMRHPGLELRQNGFLRVLEDRESGFLMHWFGAPDDADIEDPATVRRANPASWVRPDDLLRELHRPDGDELAWRRLHLNQFTATRDVWLPIGCWEQATIEKLDPEEGAELWLGVDVGLYDDTTAVVWAWRLEDGRIGLAAKVWSAVHDVPAHVYVDHIVDLEAVEHFIGYMSKRYRVREVAYDPRYFQRSAEILERRGLRMVEFLQASAPMADAYSRFYSAAREGRIAHAGDKVFAAHVNATAAEMTERGWKVRKLKSSQRIDALVAAVMAYARAAISRSSSYLITPEDVGIDR